MLRGLSVCPTCGPCEATAGLTSRSHSFLPPVEPGRLDIRRTPALPPLVPVVGITLRWFMFDLPGRPHGRVYRRRYAGGAYVRAGQLRRAVWARRLAARRIELAALLLDGRSETAIGVQDLVILIP